LCCGRWSSTEYCSCDNFRQPRRIEIGGADIAHLALDPHFIEPAHRIDITAMRIVPPMELDQIEPLGLQPLERLLDDAADVVAADIGQDFEIRHKLGVHLHPGGGFGPTVRGELQAGGTDQFLDAGIDVGAVIGDDARIECRDEIVDGLCAVDLAMAAGELPAAANDPRNRIIRCEFKGLRHVSLCDWAMVRPSYRHG
jgi:hypothetical protein